MCWAEVELRMIQTNIQKSGEPEIPAVDWQGSVFNQGET